MSHAAYLFPGQGAQAPGMGKAFYDQFEESRTIYRRANKVLGFDVTALCFEGPQEELTRTERCQPALLVTSIAACAALHQLAPDAKPVGAAGLSLGELTALTDAEAFRFKDALYLVQARGDLMAECAAQQGGAMCAVMGLKHEAIGTVCRDSGASAANYTAPDQVVLSGSVESIQRAEELAKEHGAKRVMKLEVAGAFHSHLMQPAADKFKRVLAKVTITRPTWPIISNVTGRSCQEPEEIRQLLVSQITSPVLWEPSIQFLTDGGATTFVEFPPARILTGLLRRIDKTLTGLAVNTPEELNTDVEAIKVPA